MSDVGQNATYAISYRTGLRAKILASLSTENTFSTSSFFSIFNNREGAGPSLLMNLSDDGLQTATTTALFGTGGRGTARVGGRIFCVFLLRLDLLEGDIHEGEVLLRGRETDCRCEDVLLSTKFLV